MEAVLSLLAKTLKYVVLLLPDSPFQALNNSVVSQYLPLLNWLFPFAFIVTTLETWLSAIVVYYCYSVILRWVKAVK